MRGFDLHDAASVLPATPPPAPIVGADALNAMTIDVDYFQVSAFDDLIPRTRWDSLESRVVRSTERLLELFEAADVRATFFTLGWVAERFPGWCARSIAAATRWLHTVTGTDSCTRFLRRISVRICGARAARSKGPRACVWATARRAIRLRASHCGRWTC